MGNTTGIGKVGKETKIMIEMVITAQQKIDTNINVLTGKMETMMHNQARVEKKLDKLLNECITKQELMLFLIVVCVVIALVIIFMQRIYIKNKLTTLLDLVIKLFRQLKLKVIRIVERKRQQKREKKKGNKLFTKPFTNKQKKVEKSDPVFGNVKQVESKITEELKENDGFVTDEVYKNRLQSEMNKIVAQNKNNKPFSHLIEDPTEDPKTSQKDDDEEEELINSMQLESEEEEYKINEEEDLSPKSTPVIFRQQRNNESDNDSSFIDVKPYKFI